MSVGSESDEERTGLRLFAAMSGAWDLDATDYQDFVIRCAPEVLLKYRGFSVSGIGYAGFNRTGDPGVVRYAMSGGLFQSAYRIDRRYEVSARYAIVDFDGDVRRDAYDRAQSLIADAYGRLTGAEYDDFVAQYKNAGKTTREQEITFGLNIYFDGHSLKLQTDGGWLIHSRIDADRTDAFVRSQLQLAF